MLLLFFQHEKIAKINEEFLITRLIENIIESRNILSEILQNYNIDNNSKFCFCLILAINVAEGFEAINRHIIELFDNLHLKKKKK